MENTIAKAISLVFTQFSPPYSGIFNAERVGGSTYPRLEGKYRNCLKRLSVNLIKISLRSSEFKIINDLILKEEFAGASESKRGKDEKPTSLGNVTIPKTIQLRFTSSTP
ncbi:MAG: hypothetical protein CW716_10055 [Candidatus Bathyarchaeum sp.]|nr:MAG: hypothetical protein CW716_10055 [Candidatus Bathyarchaeum sp.]